MLSNAYLLAKIRFGTAENEPAKNVQNNYFEEKLILLILLAGSRAGAQGREGDPRFPAAAQFSANEESNAVSAHCVRGRGRAVRCGAGAEVASAVFMTLGGRY